MENLYNDPINFTEIFYGQWNPPEDKVAYLNYFRDKRNGFFIEAGAGNWGLACKFFINYLGWDGLCIEPSKYTYRNLKENCKVNTLWGALHYFEGLIDFTDIVSAPGGGNDNGSLFHTPYHKKELDGYKCGYDVYEVPVYTYKAIIEMFSIEHVDYLSLDVEGNELNVLKGMEDYGKTLPDVMCIEYPYVGLRNLKVICANLGYKFDFTSFNNAFFSKENIVPVLDYWYGETKPMEDLL